MCQFPPSVGNLSLTAIVLVTACNIVCVPCNRLNNFKLGMEMVVGREKGIGNGYDELHNAVS